jgi:hypothetical protein
MPVDTVQHFSMFVKSSEQTRLRGKAPHHRDEQPSRCAAHYGGNPPGLAGLSLIASAGPIAIGDPPPASLTANLRVTY